MSLVVFRPRRRAARGYVFRVLDLVAALIVIAAGSALVANLFHL